MNYSLVQRVHNALYTITGNRKFYSPDFYNVDMSICDIFQSLVCGIASIVLFLANYYFWGIFLLVIEVSILIALLFSIGVYLFSDLTFDDSVGYFIRSLVINLLVGFILVSMLCLVF